MIIGVNTCEVQRVPDITDIDKIEKMLDDLGERELEIGEMTEEDLLRIEQEQSARAARGGEEAPALERGAETRPGGEEAAEGAEEEDFAALLQDIQIGLEEEKELEGLMAAEAQEPVAEEIEPSEVEGIKVPELETEDRTLKGAGPEVEEFTGLEEEAPVETPGVKEPVREEEAEAFPEVEQPSLASAIEYVPEEAEIPGVEGGPPAETPELEHEISKEMPVSEISGVEPSGMPEVSAGEKGVQDEEEEIDLDLPEDFDLEDLAYEEKPPEGLVSTEEPAAAEEEVPEEPVVSEELEQPPLKHPEIPAEAKEPAEHPELEGEEEGEALGFEELAGISGEEAAEGPPEEEEFEFPEFELPELETGEEAAAGIEIEEEITELPKLEGEETPQTPEEFPEEMLQPEELPAQELPSEELPIEELPPEELPPEELPAEELPEEAPMELTDEDIVVIKARLKQLSPQVASFVRDSILSGKLPVAIVNEMLRLLLTDAPEQEIIRFVEQTTGQKLAVRKPVPGIITVERKPGALENIYRSLGPLVRVTGLFVIIMVILSVLFMLFLYKPMRARQYYMEGITYIKNAQYELAERSFNRAKDIYESVRQYDNFGWEYMMSGNYDAARRKLASGIKLDEGVRNLSIRLHMALLHNILGEYADADRMYDEILKKSPNTYEYIRLKGMNLIDWGKTEQPDKLDEAYSLFNTAFDEKPKQSDPLFKMLSISIYQENTEDIAVLYEYITNRFPQNVDAEVYTDLVSYFIKHEQFEKVRDLLLRVLDRFPEYPRTHMTFANYYKAIKNRQMQEEFLKSAIIYENDRPLKYPWDKRDRALLSNAYNDLGEIYAEMETPGMAAESIRYFKKAIDQNRRNVKAYYNLAQVYFYKEKNYGLAKQYYEAAEAGGFKNYDLDYNLGLLYFYEHSFTKALDRWSELAEVFPDNPNIEFAMGCAMLHLAKYNAALGEFLLLSEVYDDLVKKLGEIKPWRAYHKRILLESAAALNNLGVAYQKLSEKTGNKEYQKKSLLSLYKAGELADITGTERGKIQYNINYILHPDVIRSSMAIDDNLSDNYRFIVQ